MGVSTKACTFPGRVRLSAALARSGCVTETGISFDSAEAGTNAARTCRRVSMRQKARLAKPASRRAGIVYKRNFEVRREVCGEVLSCSLFSRRVADQSVSVD